MPELHSDTIAEVILLAREIGESTQVGAHDGVRHRSGGAIAEQEFRSFVSSLTDDEKYSLVAVLWIGREDFSADEYDEALATAAREATTPTEDYLLGIPQLSSFLESGLEALGVSATDVEDDLM
ncbi:DUF3775 domain-containing protein [Pseudoruegeria sp. SK021]|uniref:DUF3775 domain-containing protein n=1 Tax=Pseudoruegeria sp. SK021 TaxID=1933035 RepID=UPI000A248274|nr:DUF3775 domain-containing protein [Pseudoruegeria sp. SK021]OSP55023.1 hypothetical protein BV911_09325 [Pseudoruegeria sp. SK021]